MGLLKKSQKLSYKLRYKWLYTFGVIYRFSLAPKFYIAKIAANLQTFWLLVIISHKNQHIFNHLIQILSGEVFYVKLSVSQLLTVPTGTIAAQMDNLRRTENSLCRNETFSAS